MRGIEPLLRLLGDLSGCPTPLIDRRGRLLDCLGQVLRADARYWAWGRGHPARGGAAPLAIIHQGFTPEQMGHFVTMAMDPRCDHYLRTPFLHTLANGPQFILDARLVWSDAEWERSDFYLERFAPIGMPEAMACVRYCAGDTWAQLMFMRRPGVGRFDADDRECLNAVMANVGWLAPAAEETPPADAMPPLSGRQRAVLLLLLDGMSRKHIAEALFISEHTVGDHIKAVYRHFGVNSIGQLAATFMKSATNI